jgi:RNA polymerase sigma-70 factor (ECF subfamily)
MRSVAITDSLFGRGAMSTPKSNAERWLPAAQAGSKDALAQMLEAYRGYLLLIASQELDPALRSKGGASDLVQETILEAYKDFARFQGGEEELLAWLRQLLRNNLANFARRYRDTRKRQMSAEIPLQGGALSSIPAQTLIGEDPTPSANAMANEQAEAVEKALQHLPDDYRRVILLRYREELSFEEISKLMGRSANAVEKLWLRAIERLRLELERKS